MKITDKRTERKSAPLSYQFGDVLEIKDDEVTYIGLVVQLCDSHFSVIAISHGCNRHASPTPYRNHNDITQCEMESHVGRKYAIQKIDSELVLI